jgi:hypothetical protein
VIVAIGASTTAVRPAAPASTLAERLGAPM